MQDDAIEGQLWCGCRNRAWFQDPPAAAALHAFLSQHDIVLVAADELRHETAQKDREQSGLPPGQRPEVLPIALAATSPSCSYVRVHRRYGTTERHMPDQELKVSRTV